MIYRHKPRIYGEQDIYNQERAEISVRSFNKRLNLGSRKTLSDVIKTETNSFINNNVSYKELISYEKNINILNTDYINNDNDIVVNSKSQVFLQNLINIIGSIITNSANYAANELNVLAKEAIENNVNSNFKNSYIVIKNSNIKGNVSIYESTIKNINNKLKSINIVKNIFKNIINSNIRANHGFKEIINKNIFYNLIGLIKSGNLKINIFNKKNQISDLNQFNIDIINKVSKNDIINMIKLYIISNDSANSVPIICSLNEFITAISIFNNKIITISEMYKYNIKTNLSNINTLKYVYLAETSSKDYSKFSLANKLYKNIFSTVNYKHKVSYFLCNKLLSANKNAKNVLIKSCFKTISNIFNTYNFIFTLKRIVKLRTLSNNLFFNTIYNSIKHLRTLSKEVTK